MILKEIEGVPRDKFDRLPATRQFTCRPTAPQDAHQRVVERHLVIQVVKATLVHITMIKPHVIDLGNKADAGVGRFDLSDSPLPECYRHHVRHVAAEPVNALVSPELQDVEHARPGRRNRVEVGAAVPRVNAVVEFHGFIPVVAARRRTIAVVACCAGGIFVIGIVALSQIHIPRSKTLPCEIIEIVLRVKELLFVVALSQIFYFCVFCVACVFACHMVGHEVDDDLETSAVGAVNQRLKLRHAVLYFHCHIRTHVVVVADGIG